MDARISMYPKMDVDDGFVDVQDMIEQSYAEGFVDQYETYTEEQISEGMYTFIQPTAGCTDPTAKNYDPDATIDDGSCEFYTEGELLLQQMDLDGDGQISQEEIDIRLMQARADEIAALEERCALGDNEACLELQELHSSPTVICTELFKQGLLPLSVYEADAAFGNRLYTYDRSAMEGYWIWAPHVVDLMKHSAFITKIVASFARPWAKQMAYEMGEHKKGNLIGKLCMLIGLPFSRLVYKIFGKEDN